MTTPTIEPLLDALADGIEPGQDRMALVLVVDSPDAGELDWRPLGAAVHAALLAVGIDPATQASYLTFVHVEDSGTEGWKPGDTLAPPEV